MPSGKVSRNAGNCLNPAPDASHPTKISTSTMRLLIWMKPKKAPRMKWITKPKTKLKTMLKTKFTARFTITPFQPQTTFHQSYHTRPPSSPTTSRDRLAPTPTPTGAPDQVPAANGPSSLKRTSLHHTLSARFRPYAVVRPVYSCALVFTNCSP